MSATARGRTPSPARSAAPPASTRAAARACPAPAAATARLLARQAAPAARQGATYLWSAAMPPAVRFAVLGCAAAAMPAAEANDRRRRIVASLSAFQSADCLACAAGKYSAAAGACSCTSCPAGTYVGTTGSNAATDCIGCAAGACAQAPQRRDSRCPHCERCRNSTPVLRGGHRWCRPLLDGHRRDVVVDVCRVPTGSLQLDDVQQRAGRLHAVQRRSLQRRDGSDEQYDVHRVPCRCVAANMSARDVVRWYICVPTTRASAAPSIRLQAPPPAARRATPPAPTASPAILARTRLRGWGRAS